MKKLAPETIALLVISGVLLAVGFLGPKLHERRLDRARAAIEFAIGAVH